MGFFLLENIWGALVYTDRLNQILSRKGMWGTCECYSSGEKGTLAIGSQEIPTILFWWGTVFPQE